MRRAARAPQINQAMKLQEKANVAKNSSQAPTSAHSAPMVSSIIAMTMLATPYLRLVGSMSNVFATSSTPSCFHAVCSLGSSMDGSCRSRTYSSCK